MVHKVIRQYSIFEKIYNYLIYIFFHDHPPYGYIYILSNEESSKIIYEKYPKLKELIVDCSSWAVLSDKRIFHIKIKKKK